ncbi:MAG: RluA family pseudouridine synthase [Bacteroidales bacterium]|nr:RluA family pseudouridine synthase [Candidatus Latescibacterota bacterium]
MTDHMIDVEWDGARLDRFVRSIFPGMPFHAAQALIRKRKILLNGKKATGTDKLKTGDIVKVDESVKSIKPHKDGGMHNSTDIRKRFGSIGKEIPVLYEDDSILVIDKPSGLVVQPGNESQLGSLLDLLEYYRLEHSAENRTTFRHTPVHRLDRGTSGVLIVAKTRQEARILSREFAAGSIEKIYLAIVEGRPEKKSGRIENPLKTSKDKISDTALSKSGKRAVTDFRILREMPKDRSLLEIRIGTGRTHQIRAHMASIGHPVAGDRQYGSTKGQGSSRLLLHSWKTIFDHPEKGRIELTAPEPTDFRQ